MFLVCCRLLDPESAKDHHWVQKMHRKSREETRSTSWMRKTAAQQPHGRATFRTCINNWKNGNPPAIKHGKNPPRTNWQIIKWLPTKPLWALLPNLGTRWNPIKIVGLFIRMVNFLSILLSKWWNCRSFGSKVAQPQNIPKPETVFFFHDSFRFFPFNSKNLVKGISPCRSWVKYCSDRVCSCPSRKALSDTAPWGRIETCEDPTKWIKIPLFGRWPSSFPSYLYLLMLFWGEHQGIPRILTQVAQTSQDMSRP